MNKRTNLWILFFTMVVVMLGFGLIIPILPFYVKSFGASGRELGGLMAVFSIMQFLMAPFWGSLSDRIGRKPVLILGIVGNALSMVTMGLSQQMWMLFASRALAGILSSATLPTAMAYIGDSTTHRERGGGMGVIGAAMGIGMVLGPGIGGWLASESLSAPFFLAAVLSLVAAVLILLVLPESLPIDERSTEAARFRLTQITGMGQALFGPMGFLFFLAFLVNFALAAFESIFGLFVLERFGYGPEQVGTMLTVVGLVSSVVQGLLTGPATRWLGEETVIKLSLAGSAVGYVLMLVANSYAGVLLTVGAFVTANAMLRPAISSLTSKQALTGQGVAMGISNGFMSLGRAVGPLWAGALLDINLLYPYLSAATIMLVSFILSLPKMKPRPRPADQAAD